MGWSGIRKAATVLAAAALAAGACTSSPRRAAVAPSPKSPGGVASATASGYRPVIDPANFVSTIRNPFFPLKPGTTLVYEGVKDGDSQRDEVVVTGRTKMVLGVRCVVVEDTFWIVSLTQPVSVPYGHFDEALLTLEFTRLEPKVIDEKEYVRGVGLVRESAAAGPKEAAELVSVTAP